MRCTKQHSAYLHSSLGSLKLLLQGLVSGQEGAAPPLLLAQASLSHTHTNLITYTYICKTEIHLTSTHSHTQHVASTRTHIISQQENRRGACAGSAVSAFSGTSKYPCLNKASDMLRKASRITTVSISPRPSSNGHAIHPASLNFTPKHALSHTR